MLFFFITLFKIHVLDFNLEKINRLLANTVLKKNIMIIIIIIKKFTREKKKISLSIH